MEVIYSLIPGMAFFGLLFVVILIVAVKNGQYEDMDGSASRILFDDEDEDFHASQRKPEQPETSRSDEHQGEAK
jgi:cbb3-type cytochrome oxidase maturation protein